MTIGLSAEFTCARLESIMAADIIVAVKNVNRFMSAPAVGLLLLLQLGWKSLATVKQLSGRSMPFFTIAMRDCEIVIGFVTAAAR